MKHQDLVCFGRAEKASIIEKQSDSLNFTGTYKESSKFMYFSSTMRALVDMRRASLAAFHLLRVLLLSHFY
jgi:hypothetical protein